MYCFVLFRVCVEAFTGNACPVCGIPSYHRDIHINRQMDLATSLCQQLSALLLQADTLLDHRGMSQCHFTYLMLNSTYDVSYCYASSQLSL